MDLDELIRTELTTQAGRAPDPATVLAGVPARARARRHRRLTTVAAAAAAAFLAAAVPYAALHTDRPAPPTPPAAPAAAVAVTMSWAPTWRPPGLSEVFRRIVPGEVEGQFADLSRTGRPAIVWSVDDGAGLEAAVRDRDLAPVPVGPYRGYWVTRQANLAVRLDPRHWARIRVLEPLPDQRGTALRLGASFRRGGADIDVPVRFDRLPEGFAVDPAALSADGGASDAWNVQWALAGRGSRVVVNATRGRPEEVRYPHETARTPVRIGSRTGSWVTVRGGNLEQRLLQVPLGDGVTLILGDRKVSGDVPVPEPVIELIAAGAVRLPADYSWMDR